jgi:hypothetical protein
MTPPTGMEHRAIVDTHRHPIGPKLAAKMAERGFYDPVRWLPSSEQFPRFDKYHSTGFEGCGNFMRRPRRVAG